MGLEDEGVGKPAEAKGDARLMQEKVEDKVEVVQQTRDHTSL